MHHRSSARDATPEAEQVEERLGGFGRDRSIAGLAATDRPRAARPRLHARGPIGRSLDRGVAVAERDDDLPLTTAQHRPDVVPGYPLAFVSGRRPRHRIHPEDFALVVVASMPAVSAVADAIADDAERVTLVGVPRVTLQRSREVAQPRHHADGC